MKSKIALVAVAVFAALSVSACGSDDTDSSRCVFISSVNGPSPATTCEPGARVLSTINPMTTQQTTTTAAPTSTTTTTSSTTTSATTTTTTTTVTPTAVTVYITPTTTTASATRPPANADTWYITDVAARCTGQEVQLGTQQLFGTTVTLQSNGGKSTIAFSNPPDFPLSQVLVTAGELDTTGGLNGTVVANKDGKALVGSNITALTSNGGGVVTIYGASNVNYAIFCF